MSTHAEAHPVAASNRLTYVKGRCKDGVLWSVSSLKQGVCCSKGAYPTGKASPACAPPGPRRGRQKAGTVGFFCAAEHPFEVFCPAGMSPTCNQDSNAKLCDYRLLDELLAVSSLTSTIKNSSSVVSAEALEETDSSSNPEITPTPWCDGDDDVSPPDPAVVKNCLASLMQTALGKCLAKLVKQNPKNQIWPDPADVKACGCEFSHIDERVIEGRVLYTCAGPPNLRISPVAPTGLGIMNLDVPGCMFDLVDDPKGTVQPEIPGENCFECHRRSDPESAELEPCTPTPTAIDTPEPGSAPIP
jgi:hypothetical protein